MALDYNNCVSSHRISRLVQEIKHQRELMEVARLTQEKKCSIFGADKYCITNYNMSITKDALFSVEEMCWPSSRPPSSILNPIQGLGCRTNRSLNFFLIDSKQYPQFLHNLGYTANQLRLNANVALIVDPKVIFKDTIFNVKTLILFLILKLFYYLGRITLHSESPHDERECRTIDHQLHSGECETISSKSSCL